MVGTEVRGRGTHQVDDVINISGVTFQCHSAEVWRTHRSGTGGEPHQVDDIIKLEEVADLLARADE